MIRSSLRLAVALFLPLTTSAQTTETAGEIVARALAARGGIAKIKAVQSQRVEGTLVFGKDDQGPFFVELKRPGKMHMEMTVEGKTIVRVYDGKSSGWMINPFAKDTGVQSLNSEDLVNISDESDFDGPLVDYQAKGSTISFAGKVSLVGPPDIAGTPVLDIKLTKKDGDVRHYLFDASTYMLLKWEGTREQNGKKIPVESFFRDYRDVDGLKFAFEIDSDTPGTERSQKLLIKKITLNPQIDDAQFTKPAAPPPSR
jgi:outer membrane lipoprotein-sorting protein